MKKPYIVIVSLLILLLMLTGALVVVIRKTNQAPDPVLSSQEITLTAVRAHASAETCWIIVGSKVYDLTPYIGSHPNDARFTALCGSDGTDTLLPAASPKNNVALQKLLATYYIGIIVP